MCRGGNIQGIVHLENQNYLCNESLKCRSKKINGHKNANDSHNYQDENHDEIELYLGNSDRSTKCPSTLEQRTPKKNNPIGYTVIGVLLSNVQCHMVPISIPWHREYWTIQLTPHSREMLDRRWANVVTHVTNANDVGPTWICPSVQRWHNVVTPPTMTLCQSFANVITFLHFVIFDGWYYICTLVVYMSGWLSIGITSLSPIVCRRLRLR